MSAAKIRAIEHNSKHFWSFLHHPTQKNTAIFVQKVAVLCAGRGARKPNLPVEENASRSWGTRCEGKEGVYGRWKNMMHP